MVQVHLGPSSARNFLCLNEDFIGTLLRGIQSDINHVFPGAVAQLGERQLCKLDVIGSIPISSTRIWKFISEAFFDKCIRRVEFNFC